MTSERLLDTIDNVASTMIKQMELGSNTIEIKNDVSTMILKKDNGKDILRKVSFPPSTSDNEGATDVRLLPTMVGNLSSTKNNSYSLQVSKQLQSIFTSKQLYTLFITVADRQVYVKQQGSQTILKNRIMSLAAILERKDHTPCETLEIQSVV